MIVVVAVIIATTTIIIIIIIIIITCIHHTGTRASQFITCTRTSVSAQTHKHNRKSNTQTQPQIGSNRSTLPAKTETNTPMEGSAGPSYLRKMLQ